MALRQEISFKLKHSIIKKLNRTAAGIPMIKDMIIRLTRLMAIRVITYGWLKQNDRIIGINSC
jgi:hypothetical protein